MYPKGVVRVEKTVQWRRLQNLYAHNIFYDIQLIPFVILILYLMAVFNQNVSKRIKNKAID